MFARKDLSALRTAVEIITPILAQKSVKVTQRGMSAYVKYDNAGRPETINVPYLPDDAPPNLIRAIQGFIDHEVGHVLDTDFAVISKGRQEWDKLGRTSQERTFLNSIHNIIEDIYVEKCQTKRFRGSGVNLGSAGQFYLDVLTKPELDKLDADPDAPESAYIGTLLFALVRAWGGQSTFENFMADYWAKVPSLSSRITEDMRNGLRNVSDSGNAVELTREFHSLVKDLFDPPPAPPPPPPQDQEQDQEGEDGQQGEGDDSDDCQGDEPQDPNQDPGENEDGGEEGQGGQGNDPDDQGESSESQGGDKDEPDSDQDSDQSDPDDGEPEDDQGGDSSADNEPAEDGGDEPGQDGSDTSDDESDEPEDDQGDSNQDSDQSESDDGEPEDQDGNEGGGQPGETEGGEESESDGDAGAGHETGTGGDPFSEIGDRDFGQALGEAIADATSEIPLTDYPVYTTEEDFYDIWNPRSPCPNSLAEMIDKVDGMIGTMARTLERVVKTKGLARWSPGHRRGRLDRRSVSRIALTNTHPELHTDKVFAQKELAITNDVAVSIVVDLSSSMRGGLIETALYSAYGLAATLDRLKISSEVVGFTTKDLSRELMGSLEAHLDQKGQNFWSSEFRIEALYNPILKGFGERMNPRVAQRFSSYRREGNFGYTIVGECVQKIHDRLIQRPENGKLMMILTDGSPCGAGGADMVGHAKKVVSGIEKDSTVDIFGIGIKYDVSWLFQNSTMIMDVKELPDVLMRHLSAQVLSKIHG